MMRAAIPSPIAPASHHQASSSTTGGASRGACPTLHQLHHHPLAPPCPSLLSSSRLHAHQPRFRERGALQSSRMEEAMPVEDVCFATLLSELVYRAADCADEAAFRRAQAVVEQELGARLNHVRRHKSGGQRYLVGESDAAIYVAFQGTKSATDWLANLNFFHGHFGFQQQHQAQRAGLSSSSSSSSLASSASVSSGSSSDSEAPSSTGSFSSSGSSSSGGGGGSGSARAHIGFLRRANSAAMSISALHESATAAGKRLVLTGHSLGGAVAVLTTVRLLRSLHGSSGSGSGSALDRLLLDGEAEPRIRCISFATPAVANTDLLQEVTAAGWDQFITNIVMPEDPVVPFVNLLLKAPASPSKPQHSPRSLFRGDLSPASSSGSSSINNSDGSSSFAGSPRLTRSGSSDSQASLDGQAWEASLQFEPMALPADLGANLAAAGAAALQPLQAAAAAAAAAAAGGPWGLGQVPELAFAHSSGGSQGGAMGLAMAADAMAPASPSGAAAGSSSAELANWLAAAQVAVRAQQQQRPGQRSFAESSRFHSSSGSSLCSLQSDLWQLGGGSEASAGGSGGSSPVARFGRCRSDSGVLPGPVLSFSMATAGTGASQLGGSSEGEEDGAVSEQRLLAALAASPLQQQQQRLGGKQQQQRPPLRSQVMQQVKRLQQQLRGSNATRLAWISGAVAASLRCAAAFAAPSAAASVPHLSLLALLPRALVGPAALAALHLVGHAAYKAAMPPSHPLGQQWVMTGAGLELVAKPLAAYPRNGESLGLRELGGLFPGHRMIAYRRRLAALVSQRQ